MTYLTTGKFAMNETPAATPGAFKLGSILTATCPHPAGTTWNLQLGGWRGAFPLPGIADNVALDQARANITLGGGANGGTASDTFSVDWPAQGASVELQAVTVRVEFTGVVSVLDLIVGCPPPALNAWLTHGQGSHREMTATLTEPMTAIAPSAFFLLNIPRRARAFRFFTLNADDVTVQYSQLRANNVGVDFGFASRPTAALADYMTLPSNRSAWFPVHPLAVQLELENLSGVGTVQLATEWVIETT